MKMAPAATIANPPIEPATCPATPLVVEGLAVPAAVPEVPEVPEVFVALPVAEGIDVEPVIDPVPVGML